MALDRFETFSPSEIPSGNAVDTTDFGDPLEDVSATGSRMTVFLDDTHFMNTSSRNHSTAIFDPESTSISILASSDDPLPFSSLSPSAFSRDSWHNLSVIFESSESTNSLPERSLSNQDGEDISKTSSSRENVGEHTKNVEGKRYRLPSISSLAPRLGRLRELSPPKAINVAQRIAYFENSSRGSAVSSFRSSPSPKTDARRPLQTTITHQPTHLLPNALSSPSSLSYGDTTSLGERLQIGLIWFLGTHKRSNAQWVRCKATLYRSALHLAWHAPDLKRYVAQLDLLKCTDVRSTPTLSHPSMTEDPGAMAWKLGNIQGRVSEGDIFPIQMVYADGTERIGTNNLRERLSWVASIWNAINSNVSGNPQRCTSTGLSTVNGPNSVKTSESNIQSTLMSVPTTQGTGSADHDYLRRHFRSFSSDDIAWSAQDGQQPLSKFIRARNNLYPGRRPHQRDLSEERPSGTTSSISSTPPSSPRIRAVSLKYISSLLSSRTLRHEESHPLNSSQSTMSESLYRTAPESKDSSSVVSSQITTLESEARLRPSRLRKTKPRIQHISTLGPELLVYQSCSDSSAPMLATTTQTDIILSASSHGEYSVNNQITSSDLPSPMYHTASEGNTSDTGSLMQDPIASPEVDVPGPAGPLRVRAIDSTLVTSSDLTSSDARLSRANETSPSIRLSEAIGDLRTRGEIDGMLAASSASHPGTLSSPHISSSSIAVSLDNTDVGCPLFPYSLHPPSVDSTPRNTSFNKIPNSPCSMPNPGDTSEATPQMKVMVEPLSQSQAPPRTSMIPFPRIISRHEHVNGSSENLFSSQDIMSQLDADEQFSRVSYPSNHSSTESLDNIASGSSKTLDLEVPAIQVLRSIRDQEQKQGRLKLVPKTRRPHSGSELIKSDQTSRQPPSETPHEPNIEPKSPPTTVSTTPVQASFRDLINDIDFQKMGSERSMNSSTTNGSPSQILGCQEQLKVLMDSINRTQDSQTGPMGSIYRQLSIIERHLQEQRTLDESELVTLDKLGENMATLIAQIASLQEEIQRRGAWSRPEHREHARMKEEVESLKEKNEHQNRLIVDLMRGNAFHYRHLLSEFERLSERRVEVNVHKYLQEFSAMVSREARTLLGEVGSLREHKRNLVHEIDCLVSLRSKVDPGGELDPDWEHLRDKGYHYLSNIDTPVHVTPPSFAEGSPRNPTESAPKATNVGNRDTSVPEARLQPNSHLVFPAFVARGSKRLSTGLRQINLDSAPHSSALLGLQAQLRTLPQPGYRRPRDGEDTKADR